MITDTEAVDPLLSVTVTEYVPAERLVAAAVCCWGEVFQEYK